MKIEAISKINHDGKEYEAGATLDVSEEQAETLIKGGSAIEPARKKREKAPADDKPATETDPAPAGADTPPAA